MSSVMSFVRDEVEEDHRIRNALALDIVNYRKLARLIRERMGGDCSLDAISMSLHRIQKNLKTPGNHGERLLRESQIQLRDNIITYYIDPSATIKEPVYENARQERQSFHIKIRGTDTTTVIVDARTDKALEIPGEHILDSKRNLTALTVTSPPDIVDTPGAISKIVETLGNQNINIVELTSSYDNTVIIFEAKDSLKAVKAFRELTGSL